MGILYLLHLTQLELPLYFVTEEYRRRYEFYEKNFNDVCRSFDVCRSGRGSAQS